MKKVVLLAVLIIALQSVVSAQCSVTLSKAEGGCGGDTAILSANAWVALPVNPVSPTGYCVSNAQLPSEADIRDVRFGAINNSSICSALSGTQGMPTGMAGEYSDYTGSTAPVATFQRGTSHTLNINSTPCNWTGQYLVLAFIDYNQDGDFADSGEEVYMSNINFMSQLGDINRDTLVTIPMTANLGVTRMRVTNIWNTTVSNHGCGTFMCGEVEDYLINIDDEPYTYSWSPATGLSATNTQYVKAFPTTTTTYTVTATSVTTGSSSTATITIDPPVMTSQITTTNAMCYNGTGSLSATVTGGVTPITYNWYDGTGLITSNATGTINNLPAGNYSLIALDANGCSNTTVATVSMPAQVTIANSSVSNVQCYGANNGSITVNVVGGTGAYTYDYNGNAAVSNVITNLPAGYYLITVADANNCTNTIDYTITQPADFSLFTSGGNNSAQVNVVGGTGTYTYNWMPGNYNTSSISGVAAGTYTVTVTDQNNCNKVATVGVTNPTGVGTVINSNDVKLYPNPTSNELQIVYSKGIEEVEILDMQGKILMHKNVDNKKEVSLQVTDMASGLYIIKLNKSYVTTFTKE